jgi:hypothetical protein
MWYEVGTYFENSVNARMSGTPRETASNPRLAAQPYSELPEAALTRIPETIIDSAHTTSRIFLRDI